MYIGSSLFLLAAGAILAFAIQDRVDAINLPVVGYILMIVGAIGLVFSLILNGQRRNGEAPPPR